jgi:hypothetical protein
MRIPSRSQLRPVGYEDHLSLVGHLDELRVRIMVSLLALGTAFGLCFWQNHQSAHTDRPAACAPDRGSGPRRGPPEESRQTAQEHPRSARGGPARGVFETAETLLINAQLIGIDVCARNGNPTVARYAGEIPRRRGRAPRPLAAPCEASCRTTSPSRATNTTGSTTSAHRSSMHAFADVSSLSGRELSQ